MQTLRVIAVLSIVGLGILVYALWGRAGRSRSIAVANAPRVISVSQLKDMQPVKDIALEYHQPDLPPGPGHDQFAAQCVICHSPRYVVNQPFFPRKTWTAEVHKMVKAYGALITPDEEKEIVSYLVSWHGTEGASLPMQITKQRMK
jgi:sulfite dehydrogenase (cytochrome) subunit B